MTLEFLADQGASLTAEEQLAALRWYEILRMDKEDPQNVRAFLLGCNNWLKNTLAANQGYFELSAVGSVVRGEPKYGDIDFMLVSDLPSEVFSIGKVGCVVEKYGLAKELKGKHWVCDADREVVDLYRELLQNYTKRDLWTILPFHQDGSMYSPWTKIHLIVQANVPSIEEWNSQDRFDKVPLLRKK